MERKKNVCRVQNNEGNDDGVAVPKDLIKTPEKIKKIDIYRDLVRELKIMWNINGGECTHNYWST